jgi:hypothetical protein
MQTECSADLFGFARVEGRAVVAVFNGGKMTSDAGALLPGATNRAILLVNRFAACFADSHTPELIERTVRALVGQRVFALALGYEDLVDHYDLRHDPTWDPPTAQFAPNRVKSTRKSPSTAVGLSKSWATGG